MNLAVQTNTDTRRWLVFLSKICYRLLTSHAPLKPNQSSPLQSPDHTFSGPTTTTSAVQFSAHIFLRLRHSQQYQKHVCTNRAEWTQSSQPIERVRKIVQAYPFGAMVQLKSIQTHTIHAITIMQMSLTGVRFPTRRKPNPVSKENRNSAQIICWTLLCRPYHIAKAATKIPTQKTRYIRTSTWSPRGDAEMVIKLCCRSANGSK